MRSFKSMTLEAKMAQKGIRKIVEQKQRKRKFYKKFVNKGR